MDDLLQDKLSQLGDLDLAILVSLVSGQHCIFTSGPQRTRDLRDELRLTCTETFGLQAAVVDCSAKTTVDQFSEALLVDVIDDFEDAVEERNDPTGLSWAPHRGHSPGRFGSLSNALDDRRIADVVVAHHLDRAGTNVQVQTLELLRTKRIFTRTSMHTAPKDFLFIVVLSKQDARLSHHLHDMFAMSHFHAEEDGLPHLEGTWETVTSRLFATEDIKHLRSLADRVKLTGEVAAYLHNIVVFMRMSRFIKGGVTATATRHLRTVALALAPLHGLDYVPPSLIALAARKVYPHRLVLATAETERSLQWGSDPEAVRELLEGLTAEDVIEDVLGSVETPL
ncbi:hypothetical protein LTR36_002087 [Oleoguttula mirabilis]|uniref:magnesium chelatase n=1 Tax=Oleoguttula mirabilis TaxID=1507867 RepID=A0AAV9JN40_9PEZI|nr:hypothetical protein LTR36_002087 [Oleoguttula mirabilis]